MRAYRNHWAFWAILCTPLTFNAPAATLYVDANGTNATPPFTNWPTAATNIQDAEVVAEEPAALYDAYLRSGVVST